MRDRRRLACLACDLAPHGINVSAFSLTQQFVAEIERRTPSGKMGDVEDLKGTAVFLASPASYYLAGCTVAVDGGWLAW